MMCLDRFRSPKVDCFFELAVSRYCRQIAVGSARKGRNILAHGNRKILSGEYIANQLELTAACADEVQGQGVVHGDRVEPAVLECRESLSDAVVSDQADDCDLSRFARVGGADLRAQLGRWTWIRL